MWGSFVEFARVKHSTPICCGMGDVNFYFLNHLVCANLLVFISSRFTDSFSESWFAMDQEKVPHFASAQEEARYWRLKAEEFQRM